MKLTHDAFRLAHLPACLAGNVAPDDPNFDDCYFRDCFAMLDLIESGATSAELLAFDGANDGVFDGWRDWLAFTLAYMPPYLACARWLEAFQGSARP